MSEQKFYHSRLLDLSKVFDGAIEVLKRSYVDEKYINWFFWLLNSPFRDLVKIKSITDGLQGVLSSTLVLAFIPFLSASLSPSLLLPTGINLSLSVVIGYLLGYTFSLIFYFPMLLEFKSGHFHTGAYMKFRRQEYDLFKAAFLDEKYDFYFKGLYDYVGIILSNSSEFEKVYTMIDGKLDSYIRGERKQLEDKNLLLEEKIKQKEDIFKKMTIEYEDFIKSLIQKRDELLVGVDYVIELIKDINTILFRMKNELFTTKDLNLVSGFTLYEKRGDVLYCIEDVGTTGATPKQIPLKSSVYKDWGCVKVINEELNDPVVNEPYQNHAIVSYKMRMSYNKTWVYNFHFDISDEKAWKLLLENSIIESREVFRLIHALCLLSQEIQSKQKGAANL